MPERSLVDYHGGSNIFPVYRAIGPIAGPGTLDRVVVHFLTSTTGNARFGMAVTRSDAEDGDTFESGVSIIQNAAAGGLLHRRKTMHVELSINRGLLDAEFPLNVPMMAGPYWLLIFSEILEAGAARFILARVYWQTRRGSGRRAGDVGVQVQPAGAGVLSSLQTEARRASGRET